jgi:adenosylcobyric acid synthase
MGMARIADAPVLLVGDIDRGGVFASVYGTIKLLPEDDQRRIRGIVITNSGATQSCSSSGLEQLEALAGVPVLGVVPYMNLDLDDEDSVKERFMGRPGSGPSISP